MPETPEERTLRAQRNAHRLHGLRDSREITAAARETFLARFEREADPNGTLTESERKRRAEHLKRAYFLDLARKSAQARRKRAAA